MIEQIYQFGGIDTRTNVLTRPKIKSSDSLNVELDQNGYLRKRKGFGELPEIKNALSVDNPSFTYTRGGNVTSGDSVDLVISLENTSEYATIIFNPLISGGGIPTTTLIGGAGTSGDPYRIRFDFFYVESIGTTFGGPTHQEMIDAVINNPAVDAIIEVTSTDTTAKTFGDSPETLGPIPSGVPYQIIDFTPREGEDRLLCLFEGVEQAFLAPTVEHPYWLFIRNATADPAALLFDTTRNTPFNTSVYDGVVYLADPEGVEPLVKMDGATMYRAGVMPPSGSAVDSGGSGTRYLRVHYEFTDHKDRTFSGDYLDLGEVLNGSTTDVTLNTFENSSGHINNIDPDTFNQGTTLGFSNFASYAPSKLEAVFSLSENPNFGFTIVHRATPFRNDNGTLTEVVSFTAAVAAGDQVLSETYNDTIRKGLPPKGKHITIYNSLMVLGNYEEVEIEDLGGNKDSIIWSDLSTGGTVEAFPSLNSQDIGKSSREITGLFGDSDNLNVFKKNNLFYVSGDLVNGNYRVRDSLSEGIGCISSKSLAKVDGGCVFMSQRGIYYAQDGYKPVEFSDEIEALFDKTTLDLTRAISTTDHEQEKLLFFVPYIGQNDGKIFQYDYYHKQWFVLDSIGDYRGITIHNNELYHVTDDGIMVRNSGFNDNGVAISAHYATHWFNIGAPSVKKKFINLILLVVGSKLFNLKIATQKDWKEVNTSETDITIEADQTTKDSRLPAVQAKSMRFIFSNDIIDEDIEINGYEFEYQGTQTRPKGSD